MASLPKNVSSLFWSSPRSTYKMTHATKKKRDGNDEGRKTKTSWVAAGRLTGDELKVQVGFRRLRSVADATAQ